MSHQPLAWVKRIKEQLPELDSIPLFGNTPPFEWGLLSTLLTSKLDLQNLSIRSETQKWRAPEELREGLGRDLLVMPITLSPLEGNLFWILSRKDISRLTSWILNKESKAKAFASEILEEGFYRYLLLETLDALQELSPLQNLTPHLDEEVSVPLENLFCVDVEIHFDARSCWGRLAISPDFRKSWVRHFSHMEKEYMPSEKTRLIPLVVALKAGSVLLSQEEWKQLNPGDFVLLDQGTYDPRGKTGSATLTLGPTPLFNVAIRNHQIELLNYAFYHEENMEQNRPPKNHHPSSESHFEAAEEETIPLKDLSLFVTVELSRLTITLDELMHLNPGNLLELPIHPDQGVSLTVNGQKVGRAELVYLGEKLGIRILEI